MANSKTLTHRVSSLKKLTNRVFSENSSVLDFINIAVVITISLKATTLLEHAIDLPWGDEIMYQKRGLSFGLTGIEALGKGPLYSIWYWILSFFEKDFSQCYYFSLRAIFLFIPLLLYVLLRCLEVSPFISLFGAWYHLIFLSQYLEYWPNFSGHFVVLINLTTLILAVRWKPSANFFLWTGVGLLATMFVRANFIIALTSLLIIWATTIAYRTATRKRVARQLFTLIAFLLLVTATISVFGNPLNAGLKNRPGTRGWTAFRHSYGYYALAKQGLAIRDPDPKLLKELASHEFGAATSVTQAAYRNPLEFLRFQSRNLSRLFSYTTSFPLTWMDTAHLKEFSKWLIILKYFQWLILLLLSLSLLLQLLRRKCPLSENARNLLVYFLVIFASSTISCLVVRPLPRYLLLQSTTILVLSFVLITPITKLVSSGGFKNKLLNCCLGLVLILIGPHSAVDLTRDRIRLGYCPICRIDVEGIQSSELTPFRTAVIAMKKHFQNTPANVLVPIWLNHHLPNQFNVKRLSEQDSIAEGIRDGKYDAILVCNFKRGRPIGCRGAGDSPDQAHDLKVLSSRYNALGFQKIPIRDTELFLLLKKKPF